MSAPGDRKPGAPGSGTALCGVLLHPAGHTLSPVMHTAAYRALGIDAVFLPFDVTPDALDAAVSGMRAFGIRQLAISLPHKERVLALADHVSEEARRVGAANTLTLREGELFADNTDVLGVRRTLEGLDPPEDWKGRRAVVVGAGGAARAVVYALLELGLDVVVVNRTAARAERLARDLGARAGDWGEPVDLLVNATSVGMEPDGASTPVPRERLTRGTTVFDVVYRPLETRLLREAREAGCRTQDGLDMLVHQAIEQIRLWAGLSADPATLRGAAARVLSSEIE